MTIDVADPGDFLLCHRSGAVSAIIRAGQRVRDPRAGAHWSHVAYVETPDMLIEALTHGVKRTPITEYADVPHRLVHTHLDPLDERQALCRGWANFPFEPSSMTPSELASAYP